MHTTYTDRPYDNDKQYHVSCARKYARIRFNFVILSAWSESYNIITESVDRKKLLNCDHTMIRTRIPVPGIH